MLFSSAFRLWILSFTCAFFLAIQGCQKPVKYSNEGGFYGGDNLPDEVPVDVAMVQDAVPQSEPLSTTGNKPYTVLGKSYYPLKSARGYVKEGIASWYGKKFHGRRTSSGEIYDMWAMTAAHPVLPLPTYVQVTNLDNGRQVVVKVNDRGPFLHNRLIDLSYVAAQKLGIVQRGTGRVEVRALDTGGSYQASVSGSLQNNTAGYSEYYVQVAAYSVFENAMNMRRTLTSDGFRLFPVSDEDQADMGIPYRVRVGPYSEIEQALQAKSRLESRFGEAMTLITH